ncbi:MAG: class I SAM-dependent methyltransferase [Ruminococcus sp.]|nr:class I SAM-dependent methyltransferase [Ruminococcus sp.]
MKDNDYLINYYNEYDEDGRLESSRIGRVEYFTTRRYLDPLLTADCKIAEIGAGTGRYSVALAKEGCDVTAVELVQHNLDILMSKLDGSENIKTFLGNALDLSMLGDNAYDITLLLGPMYHLYSEEDKITALKEAVRITKPGGHILVAYCMNEATIIQYVFGCNQLRAVMDLNMITDDWKCTSEPKDLFEMVRIEDIERLNAAVPVERIKLVATDGASRYIREYLEEFDDDTFEKWLSYHFATCERQDLIGATNHSLDILRKL